MNSKVLSAAVLLTLAIGLAAPAYAQSSLVDGEVRKVDTAAEKITLRHGPMKKFDMDDGMTMVFRVKDKAMLKQVKAGDKVRFDADKINGQFTVTRIEKAK